MNEDVGSSFAGGQNFCLLDSSLYFHPHTSTQSIHGCTAKTEGRIMKANVLTSSKIRTLILIHTTSRLNHLSYALILLMSLTSHLDSSCGLLRIVLTPLSANTGRIREPSTLECRTRARHPHQTDLNPIFKSHFSKSRTWAPQIQPIFTP